MSQEMGLEPFTCVCGKSYAREGYFKTHTEQSGHYAVVQNWKRVAPNPSLSEGSTTSSSSSSSENLRHHAPENTKAKAQPDGESSMRITRSKTSTTKPTSQSSTTEELHHPEPKSTKTPSQPAGESSISNSLFGRSSLASWIISHPLIAIFALVVLALIVRMIWASLFAEEERRDKLELW